MNTLGKLLIGAVTVAACSWQAQAATASVEAFENATIQVGGPRSGSSGLAFFNIEGSSNGNFASYGAARFDVQSLVQGFDTTFGAGGWKIDKLTLNLVQSNAGFTNDGNVRVQFTGDDTTNLLAGSSPLVYPAGGDASGDDFSDAETILDYTFTEIATGTLESHVLYELGGTNSAGGIALAADIVADDLATLLFIDLDATVAATYAGFSNFTLAGPTLEVTVSAVPLPAALPMLMSALGLIVARRR